MSRQGFWDTDQPAGTPHDSRATADCNHLRFGFRRFCILADASIPQLAWFTSTDGTFPRAKAVNRCHRIDGAAWRFRNRVWLAVPFTSPKERTHLCFSPERASVAHTYADSPKLSARLGLTDLRRLARVDLTHLRRSQQPHRSTCLRQKVAIRSEVHTAPMRQLAEGLPARMGPTPTRFREPTHQCVWQQVVARETRRKIAAFDMACPTSPTAR